MNPAFLLGLAKSPMVWLAILGGLLLIQTVRLDVAQSQAKALRFQVEAQKAQTQVAVSANAQCNLAVDDMKSRLTELVNERAIDKAKYDQAIRDSQKAIAIIKQRAESERRKREGVWRSSQTCEGLGSIRIGQLCPAIADGLLDRTSRNSGKDG